MNTIQCCLCTVEIPLLSLLNHIPTCYRDTCIAQGVVPYCTCNGCQGKKTHPEGQIQVNSMNKRSSAPLMIDDLEVQELPAPKDKKIKSVVQLDVTSTSALQGKICLICGKAKSPSACTIPIVHIGKYREIKICKKQHLEEKSCAIIAKKMDEELAIISINGDTSNSVWTYGSDTENDDILASRYYFRS